jgi:hypothetical protein
MHETEQSIIQKKIALAQSEHAAIIIELMKDCTTKTPIIADTEFKTLLNAITLEVEANMIKNMVDHIENIRLGSLYKPE